MLKRWCVALTGLEELADELGAIVVCPREHHNTRSSRRGAGVSHLDILVCKFEGNLKANPSDSISLENCDINSDFPKRSLGIVLL